MRRVSLSLSLSLLLLLLLVVAVGSRAVAPSDASNGAADDQKKPTAPAISRQEYCTACRSFFEGFAAAVQTHVRSRPSKDGPAQMDAMHLARQLCTGAEFASYKGVCVCVSVCVCV